MDEPMLLSTAVLDVTPPSGRPLGGYVARVGVAGGQADPLRATMVWLRNHEDCGVLWLALDALAVDTDLATALAAAAASAAGIGPHRVVVCASHTHSAPAGWTGTIHPAVPAHREEDLIRALVTAIADTRLGEPTPVTASWHQTTVAGVGANRHRVDGPYNASVGIVALRDLRGTPVAALLDFACHPTVLGPENLSWSADWPGAARTAIEEALGGQAIAAYLQGAAGDASPRFTRKGRDHGEVARLGRLLADRVVAALDQPAATEHPPGLTGPPQIRRTTARLEVRKLPPADEIARTIAKADQAVRRAVGPELRIAQTRLEGARGVAAMTTTDLPATLDLPISLVTLGEVAWVHLPVELFASLAGEITTHSPFPVTRVVGYTDGYFGYVVDRAAEQAGSYEALISYFDSNTAGHLVNATVDFLHRT